MANTTHLISAEDIAALLRTCGADFLMDRMISVLEAAIAESEKDQTVIPARDGFQYEDPHYGLLEWMPIRCQKNGITVKMVGYHPENPARYELPSILSTVGSWDCRTGRLTGLADGTFLTAWRTGAASAVATRRLAKPGASELGVIGCGAQSVTQVHAISRVFPLQKIYYSDTSSEAMASFPSRISTLVDAECIPVPPDAVSRLVANVDILCTCTSAPRGHGPVFPLGPHRPHLHINAVGSDFPEKVEVPLELLKHASVFPDFREQALKEGECQQLTNDDITAELVDLVKDPARFESARHQLSVFDSTGWAFEDQVAILELLSLAKEHGLGTRINLEAIPRDPKNPYSIGDPAQHGLGSPGTGSRAEI